MSLASLWLGWRIGDVRRVERSIAALEAAGYRVTYPVRVSTRRAADGWRLIPERRRTYAEKVLFGYRRFDSPECVDFGKGGWFNFRGQRDDVDDADVADAAGWIRRLPSVTRVDLSATRVTGDCCPHLAAVPTLRAVLLDATLLDDADIESLASLRQTRKLSLCNTGISSAGVRRLAALMPGCEIESIGCEDRPSR